MNLDGNLSVNSRHHVTDQMRQRLLNFNIHTWSFLTKFGEKLFKNLFPVILNVRVHAENVFPRIDRRCVFVHFRSTRSSHEMQDCAVRVFVGLLHLLQFPVKNGRNLIRGVQRRPGRQRQVDLHAAFVKLRQEISSEPRQLPTRIGNHQPCQQHQRQRSRNAQTNQIASTPFEESQQHTIMLNMRCLRLRQQIPRQDRRDGERHDERCEDRNDVRHAQRSKQAAFDT